REVALTGDDVTRLLSACTTLHGQHPRLGFDELGAAVRLMLQTSADRGVVFAGATGNTERPAPGLTVGQIRIYAESDAEADVYSGEMLLLDRKTKNRTRTVPLTDGLCRVLLPFVVGKAPEAQVFSLSYAQVDHRWRRARALAGLPSLRLKDLRAQTAIAAERAGVPLTVAQRVLGHGDVAMTRRYQKHQPTMSADHASGIETALGLTGS
ncbi:MAG: tyrosine-type recombinase/integrase, partial [Bacteroidota bacterium]